MPEPYHCRRASLLALTAILAAAGAHPARAQEEGLTAPPEELVVTGRAQEFYRVDNTSFATRTPTDIMDVPQSVQILTGQLIEDQAARDITDLYRSISGVTFFSYSGITFRGFRQDEIRYDGVRGDPFAGFSAPQLFGIERIEVLKGVSGMLYGGGEPGGLINYVTKTPQFDPEAKITATAGNRNLYGISGEITGPVSDTLAFRLGGFYENEDSFRNNAGLETTILEGGLAWRAGPDTDITAKATYYDVHAPGNRLRGVPTDDDGNFLTDIRWNTNEKSDFLDTKAFIGQVSLDHRFSSSFSMRAIARYVDNSEEQQYHESRGPAAPGSTLYLREFRDQARDNSELSGTVDFILRESWGGMEHTLLFGGDMYFQDGEFMGRTAAQANPLDPSASAGPVAPLDLLNPVYGHSGIAFLEDHLSTIPFRETETKVQRYSIYAQDQITLSEQWQIIGGVRYESYEDRDAVSGMETSDDAVTFKGGIIFQPVETVSLYASFGEGFNPQGVLDPVDGGPFGPETSRQWEGGLKTELLDGRIMANIAAYHIVKSGLLISNPDSQSDEDGIPNLLQIGEVTSKGFEMDLVGDITDLWTFQANYAFNRARITGGNPGSISNAVGNRFANAPKHTLGLWTRHEIPALNSAIAGGIDYVGKRISIDGQAVKSYVTADASWITHIDQWTLQLNVRNIFDKEYAASGFITRTGHFPGEPRTVVAQVSRSF